jgi:glycerate-2-kinase
VIARHIYEAIFRDAVSESRPEQAVRLALRGQPLGRLTYGIALGNAAVSMVRGAGPVMHGIAITLDDDRGPVPKGWVIGAPDETAELAIMDVVASAGEADQVLVLLSGGAAQIVTPALARGQLAQLAGAPVRTLVASHLAGDPIAAIGGAPTVPPRPQDRVALITRRSQFQSAIRSELGRYLPTSEQVGSAVDAIRPLARKIVLESESYLWPHYWFGTPELALPAHGMGGPAQQMALQLALELRGKDLSAFCAASTGWDGPAVVGQPRPAGAFVDGTTWDAMNAARLDPAAALANHAAGPVLREVGALVITHFTGIDHGGDIVIVG